jgi:hypothetical protein
MARNGKKVVTDEAAIWAAALEGLELQRQRIEDQIRQVRERLGKSSPKASVAAPAGGAAPRRARDLSPEARKRIAQAQKKRWAEYRKAKAEAAKG